MSERVPLSGLYREARERVTALVAAHLDGDPAAADRPVPATPGWTVHDVVAHLAVEAEDVPQGRGPGPDGPTPEWTQGHVERGRDVATSDLLARWEAASPAVEALLDGMPIWPLVVDVTSHEFDLRAAFGDAGGRDLPCVPLVAKVMLTGLRPPVPLVVTTEHAEVAVGPDGRLDPAALPDGALRLRTTSYEALRWRLGRRSPAQLRAMDWDGDPAPVLGHLCAFGPAERDVVE